MAKIFIALTAFASAVLASACAHVPVTTLYKLWSFDVLAADPVVIRAAVRYPAAVMPRPGGAKLTLTSKTGSSAPVTRAFVLEEAASAADIAEIAAYRRDGYPVRAYKLSQDDARTITALLKDLKASKQASQKSTGNIGVSIDACHSGALPSQAILTSTYLKLDAASGYMTVLEDVDLRSEISAAELSEKVPPCAPAKH